MLWCLVMFMILLWCYDVYDFVMMFMIWRWQYVYVYDIDANFMMMLWSIKMNDSVCKLLYLTCLLFVLPYWAFSSPPYFPFQVANRFLCGTRGDVGSSVVLVCMAWGHPMDEKRSIKNAIFLIMLCFMRLFFNLSVGLELLVVLELCIKSDIFF